MKMNLFYPIVSVFIIAAIVFASCGKSGGGYGSNSNTPASSGNTVSIVNMSFSPANLSVSAGTAVTWTNNDAMTHTVTSDGGIFDSGNLAAGKTYSRVFATAGSYPYHCTIHPGMTGTVTVK
jgi:plastocyanin